MKLTTTLLIAAAFGIGGCAVQPRPVADVADQDTATSSKAEQNPLVVEVASFAGQRPAGLVVSSTGRVFVSFPWADGQPTMAVGELRRNGEASPYPNKTWNHWDGQPGPSALRAIVCAQALTLTKEADGEYLWVLDSGSPGRRGVVTAGPKLFKIALADDSIAQVYYFDHVRDFAPDSLLSEVRVDPTHRTAYISDATRGGVYVVDLKQRQTRAALFGHPSTQPDPQVQLDRSTADRLGVVGLELSDDGQHLIYHAIAGRTLYRVPTEALRDPTAGPEELADLVEVLGETGSAMGGLTLNRQTGELYMAALEHDAVFVRNPDGAVRKLVGDARLHQPDSIAVGGDDYLYMTARAAGDHAQRSGYVLKVSLSHLAQAALAEAEAARAREAWTEAERAAASARAEVDAAREAAATESAIAEAAMHRVARLSQRVSERQFARAKAEQDVADRFEIQEATAARARVDADAAAARAEVAQAAAESAIEAARIAAARAEAAHAASEQAKQAAAWAERSDSQARVAAESHRRALASAARAWSQAEELRATANRLQAMAEAQQAKAHAAAEAWQDQLTQAQPALAAAARARQLAEAAERSLMQARLAEVRTATPAAEPVEVADVPTN
jgi:hypothetical protein